METRPSLALSTAWWALLAAALSFAAPARPAPALSETELKCQDTIALAARNYFKARYKTVSTCEERKASGDFAPTVECRPKKCVGGDNAGLPCANDGECPEGSCEDNLNLDSKTGEKLQSAAEKLEQKIGTHCSDPIPSAVVLGLPCGTTAALSVADVAGCIADQAHGVGADRLLETVYDMTGVLAGICVGGDNDGLPCNPAGDLAVECPNGGTECAVAVCQGGTNDGLPCDPLGNLATECPGTGTVCRDMAALRFCQTTIAKESQKYAKKRQTRRRNCAKKLMAGKIDGPCPDQKTLAKLDKDLTAFRDAVLAVCSASQVLDAAKDWGFPCERSGSTTFANLTFDRFDATLTNDIKLFRCVAAAAAGDADAGAETAYPLPDAPPFSHGVAAGDQTDDAFIAWTRTDGPGSVTLEVATDEDFTTIVNTQTGLTPDAAADNTVKTEVTGLDPATQYFYRFTQGSNVSRVGRVRTAPDASSTDEVRFVWTGDSNAFFKPFTVLADDPDVWLFIGDTIYGDDERSGSGVAVTRSDYHNKYKENWSDASLRNVLANFGTLAMWDDHEVTNDFYGTNPDPGFQAQMTAGNQAFRDYLPIREDTGDPMRLYRNFQWGQAAEFFLIDDRQYRDPQAYVTEPDCLDTNGQPKTLPTPLCAAEIADPGRTYLGATQKQWLKNGLLNSTAKFKFIMNGPLISSLLFVPYDRWDGYTAERDEIINYIKTNNIKNVIFLSTDIHGLIINSQVGNATPPIIKELVSGAIGMDPIYRELPASVASFVPVLPAFFPTVTYFDIDRFNYGLIEVTPTEATVTYRDATGAVLKQLTIPEEP